MRSYMSIPWIIGVLAILSLMAVACGASAPAPAEPRVVIEEKIVEVEVEKEVVKEVLKEVEKTVFQEVVVTATPIPVDPGAQVTAKVDRVIYAFGEVIETNRNWTVGRPSYYKFDPWAETLLDLEATTNARIPRIATSWESNDDASSWTFHLQEGIPFHDGYGEVTTADVKASLDLHQTDEATSSFKQFLKELKPGDEGVTIVDDHTITFHMEGSTTLWPAMASRGFGGGEFLILSKKQIDEGLDSIDNKPIGSGPYEYGGRDTGEGIWFELSDDGDHWRGERPDFKEIEIKWVREDATRLAMLLVGESHISSLSRELQFEAMKRGMITLEAQVPTNYLTLFLGGMYFSDGDPDYDPTVPWVSPDKGLLIRQAMNKAIDRQELIDFILKGAGMTMYNTAYHPTLEGYNPEWEEKWDDMYGFDPDAAKALMAEAGYSPDNPMEFTIWNYVSSDEPETAVMVEALINYWQPIGIDLKIVDSEWGTVRSAYRAKNDMIKEGGWGNVITMRSVVDRVRAWAYPNGTGRNYESNAINEAWAAIAQTTDPDEIDKQVQKAGDDRFDNFADIPFFWFALQVTANPEVIESWTFPGTASSKTSHWNNLKAAQ